MKKIYSIFALVVASLLFTGCTEPSPELTAIPAQQPISLSAIATSAQGFTVGAPDASQTVYVFFDSQCPHCGHLWEASKPLWPTVRFGWIPVAFLNKASAAQGATLLGADNPVARMNEHKASLLSRNGGITAGATTPELKLAVEKNTKLLSSFGAESIPFIVAAGPAGKVIHKPGALSTRQLAEFLGVPPPPPSPAKIVEAVVP